MHWINRRHTKLRRVPFSFFIHELVLHLPVGGPAVMLEQLQHLLRKATRPYLTLPDGIVWQKSSYSISNGDCVEVGRRTSSYSAANGGCVQVAPAPDRVLVRDSKNPAGPALAVPTPAWRTFLTTLTPEAHFVRPVEVRREPDCGRSPTSYGSQQAEAE